MSSFEREMAEAVRGVQRNVFLDFVRAHPEMTLADLSKLARGQFAELFAAVTVGDLLGVHTGEGPKGEDDEDTEVDTRSAAGRRDFDQRVLEFIREADEPVSATDIRNHTKGSSLQVRKAVARLIEAEQVTWSGRARGTRYSPV